MGWISALPWNQAPVAFRERGVEQLPLCSSAQPGVRAVAEKLLVHGQEYLCVLKYSASFAGEQLHSLTTSLSKVLQALRRFSMELNKPQARWKENQIRSKVQRWLSGQFLEELIRYQIESHDGRWRGAERLERNLHRAASGRVTPDPTVCSAVPAPRRERSQPRRNRAVQTDPHSAIPGQDSGPGPVTYYPTWVIPAVARNLLIAQILIPLPLSSAVNSRQGS